MTDTIECCMEDQVKDTPWKRKFSREGDSGLLWFLETSYQYMAPRGFREHVSFAVRFPICWIGFRRAMRRDVEIVTT